ncbi:glycosyltransferase family 2 protein [Hymenobacter negativus]|uniref:Glycosyltransferase family 2 protein n=1 Tax=Hymenobacter negativus TaxID=2795026 RepID=A0ABS3QE57_9BACT|nr:glycosyltransferase family 2 protein [Hymenobacter negativus]MBO2009524.1 glycosyltransferase family 2 protein [Hymenobacter negativus]
MNRPILSIGIPTYNRAPLLKLCLENLFNQLAEYAEVVEVLVSNNASTDHTKQIVESFQEQYKQLRYSENQTNGGPDFNIAKCFELATAKYVWVFSDDDLLLPNALKYIIPLLQNHELGILFLKPNFYRNSIDEFKPKESAFSYELYNDPYKLMEEEHYWLTYISGVIINKDLVEGIDTLYHYQKSFLIQLGWTLPALFKAKENAKITTPLILGRQLAVVDFKLFHVFGESYPRVLTDMAAKGIIPVKARDLLIDSIIEKYFPYYVPITDYPYGEKPFGILSKSFWHKKGFWTILMPLFLRRGLYIATRPMRQTIKKGLARRQVTS